MNYRKLPVALFCLLLAATTTAQRYTDLRIVGMTPSDGTEIANGDSARVQLMLGNFGPDTLLTTDTMYFLGNLLNLPDSARAAGLSSSPFPPGALTVLQFGSLATIHNDRTSASDTTVTLCIRVVTGNLMTPPIASAAMDTLPENNERCLTVILKGKPDPTAITQKKQDKGIFSISPNPAGDKVTFALDGITEGPFTVTLTDIAGRTLTMKEYSWQPGQPARWQMDVSHLAPGLYQARIQTGTRISTGKLVIRR
ncbi:T9SS type A sorting domain-containing protein [Taibaiella koreensis]|uniref:T9SS type A sorting domain-containing protein n=1 Tax=Taibaiella koreensis TaxID=1268548 RepID=UPI000E599791|nr:T9SS type A sorting domain-containing protein [Taibaiella koreensis]